MSDTSNTPDASVVIEPISASADGKRNSHSFGCRILQQTMSYAACIWRQQVLGQPGVKTPEDWSPCREAGRCGTCPANDMRKEEELAGKAIYFADRNNLRQRIEGARQWAHTTFGNVVSRRSTSTPPTPPTLSKPHTADALDVMGEGNDYADALTVVATEAVAASHTATAAPIAVIAAAPRPMPQALQGESPLAMARRLAAARQQVS
jgi:hypothetical protein